MSALQIHTADIDQEQQLLADIVATPWNRKKVIRLAEFYEANGFLELSHQLYKGRFPQEIKERLPLVSGERISSKESDRCEKLSWFPKITNTFSPVSNADTGRNSVFEKLTYSCLPEYVCIAFDAMLVSDSINSLLLDSKGRELSDFTTSKGFLLHSFLQDCKDSVIYLKGTSIQLAARNEKNFYHWQYDNLVKLSLLEKSGVSLDDIDNFIIGHEAAGFQRASLHALGIEDNRIFQMPDKLSVLHCENLLLSKVYNRMGTEFRKHHLDWLRDRFLGSLPRSTTSFPEKVAIVRESRGYANAADVHAVLESKGYALVQPEHYGFREQIALFANARSIVAPHGAALALIGYMQEGAQVHEFYGAHVQPCFWTLSHFAGLKYSNYNCGEITDAAITSSNKGLGDRLKKSMTVDLDRLRDCQILCVNDVGFTE